MVATTAFTDQDNNPVGATVRGFEKLAALTGDVAMTEATQAIGSPAALEARYRAAVLAFAARDELLARVELRALADEAGLLATMDPLFPPRGVRQRQRIMVAAGRRSTSDEIRTADRAQPASP